MKKIVEVHGGICGFQTRIEAVCDDEQHVTFCISSNCAKISKFEQALSAHGPLDAYAAMGPKNSDDAAIAAAACCCCGCVVPAAAMKAMQVASGLALPGDATIHFCS